MEQAQFLPGDLLPDEGHPRHGQEEHNGVHGDELDGNGDELPGDHPDPAHGVGQEEFRRVVLLLLGQSRGGDEGGEECPAQAHDVAALHRVESQQGTEVQPVHAKSGGEGAHGGKHLADGVHLGFHLREQDDADQNQRGDGPRPDPEAHAPLAQFMAYKGHTASPPSV